MNVKKILILNHNVEWRGTFQRCYDFAKLLVGRGHSVTIVTNSVSARFRFSEGRLDGIRIIRTPDLFWGILRTGWDPLNVFRRYLYLRYERFDLIHAFDNRPTVILPALWLSKKWKCPLVSDWCDWWGRGGAIRLRKNKILNFLFEPIETFFEEHFRLRADFLTVISSALKERAVRLGYPESKIEMVPPLADTEHIFPVEKQAARERLGIVPHAPVLIFSGFVLYDLQTVLRAFQLVHAELPNALLIVTGGVPRSKTNSLGLPIFNAGCVEKEKLRDCLGASDLCLLPLADCLANRARYPHKIGHYLAAGRPIVTNSVGEVGRLVSEHQIGILSPPSAEAFARSVLDALNDPIELDRMGQRSRRVAETLLSGDRFAEKIELIYANCLSTPLS